MGYNHRPFIDRESLSAYLDGELSAPERKAVERLLAVSWSARNELAELRRLRTLFDGWGCPEPDPRFMQRMAIRITGQRPIPPPPWHFRWVHRFATAAMVLIAAGTLAILGSTQQTRIEHMTIEKYLRGYIDREMCEVSAMQASNLSPEVLLELVVSGHSQ